MIKERFLLFFVIVYLVGFCSQIGNSIDCNNQTTITNIVFLQNNPLGLIDHPPIVIDDNIDFETLNFTGEGTELDPYIIANLYINASGVQSRGIIVHTTSVHYEIINCTILTDYIGIDISENGAYTANIYNNTIISKTGDGGGIVITSTYGATILENECFNFMQGIHLNHAHENIIFSNKIRSSNYQGINIRYSNYNEITYNDIEDSLQHGLAIVGTAHTNIAHHNRFVNNSKVSTYTIDGERTGTIMSQGYDEGSSNTWYNEEEKTGNRWSDYEGSGDYYIDGPAGSVDIYPLMLSYNESATLPAVLIMISLIFIGSIGIIRRNKK